MCTERAEAFFLCERRRQRRIPSAMRMQLKKMVVLVAELDCGHRGPYERQLIGCTESSLAREARRQSIAVPIGFAL